MKKIISAIIAFALLLSTFVVVNAEEADDGGQILKSTREGGNTSKIQTLSVGSPFSTGDTDPYPDRNRIMPKEEADLVRQFTGYWMNSALTKGFSFTDLCDVIVYQHFIYASDYIVRGRVIRAKQMENGNIVFTVYVPESVGYITRDEYQFDVVIDVSDRETKGGLYNSDWEGFFGYAGEYEDVEKKYNSRYF